MARRKRVVVQIRIANGRLQQLGEPDRFGQRIRHDYAATAEDHGKLRVGEKLGRGIQCQLATGAAFDRDRTRNLALDIAVEEIARDVDLCGPQLEQRAVECTCGQLGHPRPVVHVRLIFGNPGEDRQLLGLLEPAQADLGNRPQVPKGDIEAEQDGNPGEADEQAGNSTAVKAVVAPGPFCAMHTPWRPDTRA